MRVRVPPRVFLQGVDRANSIYEALLWRPPARRARRGKAEMAEDINQSLGFCDYLWRCGRPLATSVRNGCGVLIAKQCGKMEVDGA